MSERGQPHGRHAAVAYTACLYKRALERIFSAAVSVTSERPNMASLEFGSISPSYNGHLQSISYRPLWDVQTAPTGNSTDKAKDSSVQSAIFTRR